MRKIYVPILELSVACLVMIYITNQILIILPILTFLLAGLGLSYCLFFRSKIALFVFVNVYAFYTLISAFVGLYALLTFDQLMNTKDAIFFFDRLSDPLISYSWEQIKTSWVSNARLSGAAPLALFVWQYVYQFFDIFGLNRTPFTGILFNVFLVSLTVMVTVKISIMVVGDYLQKLKKLTVLSYICALYVLFASLFLRDAFLLIAMTCFLWSCVRFISMPTLKSAFIHILTFLLIYWIVDNLRSDTVYFLSMLFLLSWWFWLFRKHQFLGLCSGFSAVILMFFILYRPDILFIGSDVVAHISQSYIFSNQFKSTGDSLGISLMFNQPIPIRLVVSSVFLLAFPVPIWAYLGDVPNEYLMIKTLGAVANFVIVPLFISGSLLLVGEMIKHRTFFSARSFLLLYSLMGLISVGVTTIETRHLGQFMPALLLIAIIPFGGGGGEQMWRRIQVGWVLAIIAVHLLWMVIKFT